MPQLDKIVFFLQVKGLIFFFIIFYYFFFKNVLFNIKLNLGLKRFFFQKEKDSFLLKLSSIHNLEEDVLPFFMESYSYGMKSCPEEFFIVRFFERYVLNTELYWIFISYLFESRLNAVLFEMRCKNFFRRTISNYKEHIGALERNYDFILYFDTNFYMYSYCFYFLRNDVNSERLIFKFIKIFLNQSVQFLKYFFDKVSYYTYYLKIENLEVEVWNYKVDFFFILYAEEQDIEEFWYIILDNYNLL